MIRTSLNSLGVGSCRGKRALV